MISATATEAKRLVPVTGAALRQGVIAAQAHEFERARSYLQQATAESPDDVLGWYWLAIASDSPDSAIRCLRRVLTIDAGHVPARDALAKLLVAEARAAAARADSDTARALATEASQLTPASPAPWLALAALAATHADRTDALRQLVAINPEDARLRTQLRQALLARGVMMARSDPDTARVCFREAADINPADPRVWQALASLAESRADAMQALRELLKVAPDHLRGRTSLREALGEEARSLVSSGLTEQACAIWREAITMNGGDAESWLGLADTTPDPDEAARAIETAYELNPDDPQANAAMDRLRGSRVDPNAAALPDDAFARFEPAGDTLPAFTLGEDQIDPADSLLDAFARLEEAAVAAAPLAPPAPVLSTEPIAAPAPVPSSEPIVAPLPAPWAEPVVEPAPILSFEPDVPAPVVTPEPLDEPVPAIEIAEPPVAATGTSGDARRTVMVVDDSPTIRKILGLTLERAGYTVVTEADGEAALTRLADLIPGVILLDISMPKLDGYEVCKRIKQDARTANVPVIMLSGKGAFFDKVKGHMAGATEYLTKPFETPAVLAAVNNHCLQAAEAAHG
jgi:twitching motility two-component system response regulator PilG